MTMRVLILVAGTIVAALASTLLITGISLVWSGSYPRSGEYSLLLALMLATLIAAFVTALVVCLPMALLIDRYGVLRPWSCALLGAFIGSLASLLTGVNPFLLFAICGGLGALSFWPFWQWQKRLKESGESR
jgi:hypothetical protein